MPSVRVSACWTHRQDTLGTDVPIGVGSYENSNSPSQYQPDPRVEGAFLSLRSIRPLGNNFNEFGGVSPSNDLVLPNPDLPVVQFVGAISGNEPGTITEWYLLGSGPEEGTGLPGFLEGDCERCPSNSLLVSSSSEEPRPLPGHELYDRTGLPQHPDTQDQPVPS